MMDLKKGGVCSWLFTRLVGQQFQWDRERERERLRDLTLYPRWNNNTAIHMKTVSLKVPHDEDFIFLFIALYSRACLASRQKTDALSYMLYMLYKFERRHKQGVAESLCDITEGLIYEGFEFSDRVEMHVMTIMLVTRNPCSGGF